MVGRWLCWANERSTSSHFRVEWKCLFLMWLEEVNFWKSGFTFVSQNSFLKQKCVFVWTFCLALFALTHTCRRFACDAWASWPENVDPSLPLYWFPWTWLCGPVLCLRGYRCTFLILIPPDILEEPKSFHGNLPFTYLVNLCEKSEGVIGGH